MLLSLTNRVIIIILLTGLVPTIRAETDPDSLFQQAQASYDAAQYQAALAKIEQAVALAPDNSSYHHLLGKCYGRLAEQSNPLTAFSLAKKTRKSLERAVELDRNNINALKDLMQYYRQAPGFLGGSQKKADKIQEILDASDIAPG